MEKRTVIKKHVKANGEVSSMILVVDAPMGLFKPKEEGGVGGARFMRHGYFIHPSRVPAVKTWLKAKNFPYKDKTKKKRKHDEQKEHHKKKKKEDRVSPPNPSSPPRRVSPPKPPSPPKRARPPPTVAVAHLYKGKVTFTNLPEGFMENYVKKDFQERLKDGSYMIFTSYISIVEDMLRDYNGSTLRQVKEEGRAPSRAAKASFKKLVYTSPKIRKPYRAPTDVMPYEPIAKLDVSSDRAFAHWINTFPRGRRQVKYRFDETYRRALAEGIRPDIEGLTGADVERIMRIISDVSYGGGYAGLGQSQHIVYTNLAQGTGYAFTDPGGRIDVNVGKMQEYAARYPSSYDNALVMLIETLQHESIHVIQRYTSSAGRSHDKRFQHIIDLVFGDTA